MALAQHNIDPTTILLNAKGRDITKNVLRVPDPNVLATFSIRGSTLSNPSLAELTTNEELTKSMAIIIPGIALVKMIPNLPNGAPNMPPDVKTSKSAIPVSYTHLTLPT